MSAENLDQQVVLVVSDYFYGDVISDDAPAR
jgi:hypothetical protein